MSLQDTRKGYNYQDKYALWLLLKYLRERGLIKLYVDHEWGGCHALDVHIIFEEPSDEEVYEVKTGLHYKINKNDLFLAAIASILEYQNANPVCKSYLVADSSLSPGSLQYWMALKEIGARKSLRGKVKQIGGSTVSLKNVVDKLQTDLNKVLDPKSLIRKYSAQQFQKAVQRIIILDAPKYTVGSLLDSEIECCIIGELTAIAEMAGCIYGESGFRDAIILSVLLEVLHIGTEKGVDIVPSIIDKLCELFARRSILGELRDDALKDKKNEIQKQITESLKLQIPQSVAPLSTEFIEGGTDAK